MKVIGMTGDRDTYICTVEHSELEKFVNLYYRNLERLKVGDTFDLGKGFDHARETADAMRATQEFIKSNQKVVNAILNGLQYANLPKPETTDEQAVAVAAK